MKYWPILLPALLWPAALHADEIQTKDGKKIEFKSLTDEGDTLELTTPQGTKVSVKKSDFDKYILSGVKDVPLTGAQFTFDKKRKLDAVDLLSRIDLKRDAVTDGWKKTGNLLIGTPDGIKSSRIELAVTPPEEYDLTVVVERREGNDQFSIGLIGGGNLFMVYFDWARASASGFGEVSGANPADVKKAGGFFENKKPKTITCMVRKEAFIIRADGKDWMAWKADWSKVSMGSTVLRSKNFLFLQCDGPNNVFQVSQVVLSYPK